VSQKYLWQVVKEVGKIKLLGRGMAWLDTGTMHLCFKLLILLNKFKILKEHI
jgi:hypothetical protein